MKVILATPCYGGMVCVNYHYSVLRLQRACDELRMEIEHDWVAGESLITRARNNLAARFLKTDATDLLWVDADIGFRPEEALRLLLSPYGVAAGVYRLKGEAAGFAADPADVGEIGPDGFALIREAPTGFMRIKRWVFEMLMSERCCPVYRLRDGSERFGFFDTMICPETEEYLSEDYAFCRRCEKVGTQIYVDTNSMLEHQGGYAYVGDFRKAICAARNLASLLKTLNP